MNCSRCAAHVLPSVGCTVCEKFSDELLQQIAAATASRRRRLSVQGLVLIVFAFTVLVGGGGLFVFTQLFGLPLMGVLLLATTLSGATGARLLEASKLSSNIPNEDTISELRRRVSDAAAISLGGSGSVAVPALREVDRNRPR
jgi:hypothetical protein